MSKHPIAGMYFLIVVWICCLVGPASSQQAFPQTLKGTLSNTNQSTSITLTVNDVNPQTRYLTFSYQPAANNPAIVASYLEVSVGQLPPVRTSDVSDMKKRNIDVYGYTMLKDQLVVIQKPTVPTNITLTVQAIKANMANYSFDYQITTGATPMKPCPGSCSNAGVCQQNGTCLCNPGSIAYDCSVKPIVITGTRPFEHTLYYKDQLYLKIVSTELTTNYGFYMALLNPDGNVGVFASQEDQTDPNLLPSFASSKQRAKVLNQFDRFYERQLDFPQTQNLWLTVSPLSNTTIVVQGEMYVSNYSISENAFVIFCIVLIGCIFMSMICFMKRVPPPTTANRRNVSRSARLTMDEIENYFPDVQYKKLYPKVEDRHECVICLSAIEDNEKIKLTYCNHVFHSNCLTSWFKIEQTCPYCRACFDKKRTLELYQQINLFYQSSNPGQTIKLKSEDIAHCIVGLQKSKKKCGDVDIVVPPALQEPKQVELREQSDYRLNLKAA